MQEFHSEFGNMNFKNFGRKQNLFLFFEENENEKVINSRLVNLYMNRFVIDEDNQNEINGIFKQKRVVPKTSQYSSEHVILSTIQRQQFAQQVQAQEILDSAFNDKCLLKNDDNAAHFIIASDFPWSFIPGQQSHWIEKWFQRKLETLSSQSISIAVTILSGSTKVLASSSLLNECFLPKHKRNRGFDFFHRWFSDYNTVSNDLETREDEMQRIGKDFASRLLGLNDERLNKWPYSHTPYGRIHINSILNSSARILFHHKYLWLYQMLSDSEIDTEWEIEKVRPIGPIHVLNYSENPNTTRFHRIYDCQRLTMVFILAGD